MFGEERRKGTFLRTPGIMMTSSNGNIFRVTGPLCGEFTGNRRIPCTRASDAELWCPNKRLSKQSWVWWFETPSHPLWRHCNAHFRRTMPLVVSGYMLAAQFISVYPGLDPLQWCHNGRDGVSNHQPHDCLLNRLVGCRSKKTSKLRVTGLCAGNSPVTGEFPAQRASNAEKCFHLSFWWCRHAIRNLTIS